MKRYILPVLVGLLLYLPFSKHALWLALLPALYLLFKNPKPYFWNTSGFVFFFLSLRCVNIASVEFGGLNPLLAYLIFTLFILFLTLYQFTLPLLLYRKFLVPFPLALAFLFVLFELLRSYFPYGGFPWLILGSVLVDVPLLRLSLYHLGVYGASLMLVLLALLLVHKKFIHGFILLLLVLLLSLHAGYELRKTYREAKTLRVALIQTAVDQRVKLDWRVFREHTPEIMKVVEKAVKGKPQAVFLPESAFAFMFSEEFNPYRQRLMELSMDVPIMVGLIDVREGLKPYNSVYLLDGGRVEYYDKVRLLPVGEYLPYPFGFLKSIFGSISGIDYVPGDTLKSLDLRGVKIATPVCFEIAYWDLVRELSKDANLMAVFTNDGWFKDSDCVYQHLRWARVRAVENGLYVLWLNNSGGTGVIDYMGRVLERLPYMERGILFYHVPLRP